jgi:transporter family protein
MWLILALGSAVFAALVSVLGKKGLAGVSSNLATGIRAIVALALAWLVVLVAGSGGLLGQLEFGDILFILLSGVATGVSWLCFFQALKLGKVSNVIAVDRTSLLFTGLAAVAFFGETQHLPTKILGLAVVVLATITLVWVPKNSRGENANWAWLPWALASMAFAVATTLLAKVGLAAVDSSLATGLRTLVVVIFAVLIVWFRGEAPAIRQISRKHLGYLLASGLATGASWLCYFGAIKLGEVSVVAPIDKLSIVFAAGLAALLLGEKVSKRDALALASMVLGTAILLF